MKPPENAEVFETPIAFLWFEPSGLLCSYSKKAAPVTRENLEKEFTMIRERAFGNKVCWLGDITNASVAGKEARDYAATETPGFIKALGLISGSVMTTMMANIFLIVKKPPYPTRLFTSEEEARNWLSQYL